MKVAITGASGLVGTALVPSLTSSGHEVVRLVRRLTRGPDEVPWDPERGVIDPGALEGVEAVIHLAGANIADGRWSEARKRELRDSRVLSTRLLAEALSALTRPPRALVSASAVGYYGSRGDEWLDEASPAASDFLGTLARDWEAACEPAVRAGIRVVQLRSGLVLSAGGGALARMLLPFRAGLGGVLGSGRQYVSWIAIDDLVEAVLFALTTPGLSGPVNAVAPAPVTNREFTKALGRALGRPTIAAVPAVALRLAFGEMAEATLLASTRVRPARLLAAGYRFRLPDLDGALHHLFGQAR